MKPTELVSATMLERYKIEGQIPWYSPAIEILADGTILVAYILQDARGSDVLDGLRIRHLDHNGNDLAPVVTILDTEAPRPPYQLLDPFHAMAVSAQRVAGNTVSLRVTNFGYRGTSVQDPDSLYGGPYYEVIYTVTCADGDMVVDGEAVVIDPIPSTILRYYLTSTQLNGAFITQLPGSTVSVITAGGNRVYLMDRGRLLLAFDTREQVPEGFGDFVYPIGLWPHPWKPRTFAVTYGYPSWFVGTLEYEISEDWSSYEVRIINQIAGGELNATFSTGGAVTGTYYGDYHEGSVSENCIGLSNPYSDGVQEIVSPVAVYDVLVESNTFWDYGPNARFELWRVGIDGSNPIRIGQGSNDIRYYIPSYGVSGQFLPNGIDVPGTGYILPMVTSGPSANDDSSSFYGENGITVFTVDMESNPPELHELTLPLPEETLNGLAAGGYFHKYRDGVMAIAKVGFENNVANANRTNLVFWVLKVDAGDELRLKVPGAETGTIGPDSLAEGNVHLKLKTPYGWARSLTGEEYGSDVYPLRVFTGDDNEDTEWRTAAGLTFGELPD